MRPERFRQFGIFGGGFFFTIIALANPFFTLYAEELGASTFAIGMMVTLRAILPIFIALPSGQLIDTIGPMRMLHVGMISLLISLVLTVLATGVPLLAISQLFLGASIIVMASALQVLVSDGDADTRNENIKRYSMWMSAGGMLGPILGGLVVTLFDAPLDGYRAAFAASTLVSAGFFALLIWMSSHYAHPNAKNVPEIVGQTLKPAGMIDSYRSGFGLTRHQEVQFGLTATFIIMYIQSMYMSFLPLLMSQYGYTTMAIAAAVSLKGAAGMVARFSLGILMRRFRLETILLGAGFISAFGVVLTPFAAADTVALMLLITVVGIAVGVNLPVSIMIMVNAIGEGQRGRLMGLRLLVNRFSQFLSPAMFGILGQAFGLGAAFVSGGALLVATMVGFTIHSGRALRRPATKEHPAE